MELENFIEAEVFSYWRLYIRNSWSNYWNNRRILYKEKYWRGKNKQC